MGRWSFLTNHARALLCIAADPGVRLRDIATTVGITERRAHAIVTDLVDAGYVVKDRNGRRNQSRCRATHAEVGAAQGTHQYPPDDTSDDARHQGCLACQGDAKTQRKSDQENY